MNAYKFINKEGKDQFGRYRVRPEGGSAYLTSEEASKQQDNFLFDDTKQRVAQGPLKWLIDVQLAGEGDVVDDSTVHWPENRPRVEFGTVTVAAVAAVPDTEQRRIIFDPIPCTDGIEPSGDPLLTPRADAYLLSGRRRRVYGTE